MVRACRRPSPAVSGNVWTCRKQIDRLKEAVNGAGGETDGGRSEMKRDIIDTLNLHFGCLEEQVTCRGSNLFCRAC